jgi:two-component sensor histidine kinase
MPSMPELPAADPGEARFEFRSHRKGDSYLFELEFTPNIRLVPIVRRFVSDFYGEVFADGEIISRLALATHELMENAVRHNSGGEARLTVELRDVAGERHISVRIGQTARQPEGSGLGLTRIRAEGDMLLSHTVQGQWVEITASTTCPARAS